MYTIGIIITAYNSEKFILDTVKSLVHQRLPTGWISKFYIGIDGCTKTADILKENKIPYYFSEKNVGTYILTNSLLLEAKKDFCDIYLRFDSDDIACENFLLFGINHVMSKNFIRCYQILCDENLNPIHKNPVLAHGSVFFTKSAFDKLGGYYHYRAGCDTNFYRRAEKLGYNLKISNNLPLYFYRQHSNSLMKNSEFGKGTTYRKTNRDIMNSDLEKGILCIETPSTTELEYCSNLHDT